MAHRTEDALAPPTLGLNEVLAALREDLFQAQEEARDRHLGMEVERATVELGLAFKTDKKGGLNVGVRVWALEAGGRGEKGRSETSTHKITLTLVPAKLPKPVPDSPRPPRFESSEETSRDFDVGGEAGVRLTTSAFDALETAARNPGSSIILLLNQEPAVTAGNESSRHSEQGLGQMEG